MLKAITSLLLLSTTGIAIAAAPVSALNTIPNKDTAAQNQLTVAEQLQQQANQIGNLNTQVTKNASMQDSLDTLRGQVETQSHDIAQMKQTMALLVMQVNKLTAGASLVTAKNEPVAAKIKAGSKTVDATQTTDFKAYKAAYDLIGAKEYSKASVALAAFVAKYPKSAYVSDARYWLGELYTVQGQADKATQQFRQVIADKNALYRPDAMRELGIIFLANGDSAHAKQTFQKLINDYPGTVAAKQAKQQLSKMK